VRLLALWTGTLAGPVVWLALLESNYVLSYLSCATQHVWFLHGLTAIAWIAVAAAGAWGWSAGSRSARESERWMAWSSALMSGFFLIVILAFEAQISILKPCV